MGDLVQNLFEGFCCNVWLCPYYTFSYTTLLAPCYGDWVHRTWAAWDFAEENDTLIQEAECQIDIGLFLDEYPQWGLGTPHWTIILHEMFLHSAKRGWKEAECMVCWGHWGSMYDSDSEADQSARELVGYHTSQKLEMSTRASICYKEPQVFPPAELNQGERPSRIYFLPWKANCIGVDVWLPPQTGSLRRKNKLDRVNGAPMKKLLGWPAKGHWIPPRFLQATLKGWVKEEGMGHGPIPNTKARVEVTRGPGASLEATVEPRAEIIPKEAYRMYVSCPLMDLHLEEG